MNQSQSLYITGLRGPKPLAIEKSTLMALAFGSLLLMETFAGALRFYFDVMGVSWLFYLGKIACLAAVLVEVPSFKASPAFWLVLLLIVLSSQLALLHGASLANIGFSLFALIPLLFGLACGKYLEQRTKLLAWVIGLFLLASLLGIVLDKYTALPWKGYSYMLGETELSGNKSWAFDDIDRIAGFARMSTTLSVMIALYSLFIAAFTPSRLARLLLYSVALVGIVLSTNKSTAVGFSLTLLLLFISAYRLPCILAFALVTLIGIGLPVASLLLNLDPNSVSGSDYLLPSLNDRLVNSWPNYIETILGQRWLLWGAGFGATGASVLAFPIANLDLLSIADNTPLYLWGTLGLFGIVLYLLFIPLLSRLHGNGPPIRGALLSMTFCVCIIAWTTDVLDVPIASLFLGLAISHVLTPPAIGHRPLPTTRLRDFPPLI